MSLEEAFKKGIDRLYAGDEARWNRDLFKTGIVPLDNALGGGFAYGTMAEIFGESGVAKSYLLYMLLAENQRQGGVSVLYESEGAYYPEFFMALGGNPKKLLLKPIKMVEEFFTGVLKQLKIMHDAKENKDDTKVLIGWDGIGGTGTAFLQQKGMQKRDLSKALSMRQGSKLITMAVEETRALVIATNQTSSGPGQESWMPTNTSGGKGWGYHSHQRIELVFDGGPKSSKIFSEEVVVGRYVRGEVVKNRVAPSFRTFRLPLYTEPNLEHPFFEGEKTQLGIDLEEALWNYYMGHHAVFGLDRERYISAPKKGGWYTLNSKIGERRFQKKSWKKVLEEFPQLRDSGFDPLKKKKRRKKK